MGATPFPGLLHFTLDLYLIILSVKQGCIKYHFWVFGMTRPWIEPKSPGSLANILTIMPMSRLKYSCCFLWVNSRVIPYLPLFLYAFYYFSFSFFSTKLLGLLLSCSATFEALLTSPCPFFWYPRVTRSG